MFARLGPWCHDHRKLVLIGWVVVLFFVNGVAGAVGSAFRDDLDLPAVESRDGFDLLDEQFGGQGTGYTGTIVFRAEQGVDDPEVQAQMQELFDRVAALDDVTKVDSPYTEGGEQLVASQGPEAGLIAYANVELPEESDFTRAAEIRDIILEESPDIDGLQIELGGFIFADFEEPTAELLGLAFAIVILIVAFGSVLAMGLPIGVALFGIGLGSAVTTLLSNVITIPEFAPFIGVMIGLGVGIDYALLIITRYREQLHAGHDVRESISIAMDTAGRSVLFAGMTVVISLLGMLAHGRALRAGAGGERVGHRGADRGGVAHPAPCPHRLRRRAHRADATAGPHRRRLRRRRPRRRRARHRAADGRVPHCRRRAAAGPLAAVPEGRGAASTAEAPARDAGLPLEPRRPAPALDRGPRWARRSCSCWPCPCSACALASPTRATSLRTPRPDRPTTCWSTASARASTGRSCSWPRSPRAATSPRSAWSMRPSLRTRASPSCPRPCPTTRRVRRRCSGTWCPRRDPRRRPRPSWSTGLRDDVLPSAEETAGTDVLVTGSTADQRRLRRLPPVPPAVVLRCRADRCPSCS